MLSVVFEMMYASAGIDPTRGAYAKEPSPEDLIVLVSFYIKYSQ